MAFYCFYEKIKIYNANNISNVLVKIKKLDYWCVGLAGESNQEIDKVREFKKVVLIIVWKDLIMDFFDIVFCVKVVLYWCRIE